VIIDTHCHLDFTEFNDDFSSMLDNAKNNDVLGMQTICTKIEEFPKILNIALKKPNIWCSVGTHPHNAEDEEHISKEHILELCNNEKVIGIGETGLDYFYENSKRDIQIKSLYKHIEVSRKTNLPLIIHARDADDDIIEILTTEYKKKKFTGVIHCFTASQKLADAALSIGFYISFSGIITFKNAENIRKSCEIIPINRILIETDAPFLAPIPFRGKRNEPAFITETLKKVSEIKNMPINETKDITTNNFFNLFTRAKL
jgi:TatD DNase family protein